MTCNNYTEEERIQLQEMLNDLGPAPSDCITINGVAAGYNDDGSFWMQGFIRNGYTKIVNDFYLEPCSIYKDGNIIASANFDFSNLDPILPSQSVFWGFRFNKEYVLNTNADLSDYQIYIEYNWK